MAADGEIGDAGQRDQDEVAGIGRDAGDDADEGEDIGQRPLRGDDDELADQRGDEPRSSATPAPIIATIISPTAVKLMKFGISDEYMKRMPSIVSRLWIAVLAVSILCVSGLIRSKVTAAPKS